MTIEISENFLLYSTAKEIRDVFHETFSNRDNTVELFNVDIIPHDLRHGGRFLIVYFTTLTRYTTVRSLLISSVEMPRIQCLLQEDCANQMDLQISYGS